MYTQRHLSDVLVVSVASKARTPSDTAGNGRRLPTAFGAQMFVGRTTKLAEENNEFSLRNRRFSGDFRTVPVATCTARTESGKMFKNFDWIASQIAHKESGRHVRDDSTFRLHFQLVKLCEIGTWFFSQEFFA